MKKMIFFMAVFSMISSFTISDAIAQEQAEETQLTVYYTHSTRRCVSCRIVENKTKEIIDQDFRAELESGKLKYLAVNIDEPANKPFIEKHKVWGSSLFMVKTDTEETINLSRDAFRYAGRNPELFREKLNKAIRDNLI